MKDPCLKIPLLMTNSFQKLPYAKNCLKQNSSLDTCHNIWKLMCYAVPD